MPLIDPTVAARAASAAATSSKTAATGAKADGGASGQLDNMGSEAFMKLLVAQMRYQNPMAPSEGTEYLAQVSQYAMVEQMQKVNQGQQEISAYQRSMIATSFIGKVVAGTGEAGLPISGEVIGVAYQSGRPVLVTTGGELAIDSVDEARLPTGSTANPTTAKPPTANPSTANPSTANADSPAATAAATSTATPTSTSTDQAETAPSASTGAGAPSVTTK